MSKRSKDKNQNQLPIDPVEQYDEGYSSSSSSAGAEVAASPTAPAVHVINCGKLVIDDEQPCSSKTARKLWETEETRRQEEEADSGAELSDSGTQREVRSLRRHRNVKCETEDREERDGEDDYHGDNEEDINGNVMTKVKKVKKKRAESSLPSKTPSRHVRRKKSTYREYKAKNSNSLLQLHESESWSSVSSFDGQPLEPKDSEIMRQEKRMKGCLPFSQPKDPADGKFSGRSQPPKKYSKKSPITRLKLKDDAAKVTLSGEARKLIQANRVRRSLVFDRRIHVLTFNKRMVAHRVGEKIQGFEAETFRNNPLPTDTPQKDRKPMKGILKKKSKKRSKSKSATKSNSSSTSRSKSPSKKRSKSKSKKK